jgi:hypothetical protein
VSAPRTPSKPPDERVAQLHSRFAVLWDFATMVAEHHRRVVFIELNGHSKPIADDDRADLNAIFWPSAAFVKITMPRNLTTDGLHFTPLGAAAFAHVLGRVTPATAAER